MAKQWNRIEGSSIRIIPINDLRRHLDSNLCWCKPYIVDKEDGKHIVHNSMDCRELFEEFDDDQCTIFDLNYANIPSVRIWYDS